MPAPLPAWWAALEARAAQPPDRPRLPLCIEGRASPVGSIEAALTQRLSGAGLSLVRCERHAEVTGPPDAAFAQIAQWLAAQKLGGTWRDELLPVTDEAGVICSAIERAAVRPLGIATFAVHLIAWTESGSAWVQQRALDKATDPGQWDTLVGGLVAARESVATALARETLEEAGLRLGALQALRRAERITIRRPVVQGFMVEHIDVFEAVVPEGITPVNQDGEVARFDCIAPAALIERLVADAFTLEAALMLARSLRRRGVV